MRSILVKNKASKEGDFGRTKLISDVDMQTIRCGEEQTITVQIPRGRNEKELERCIFFSLRERERLLDDIHPGTPIPF
jgi:hypothetical protein